MDEWDRSTERARIYREETMEWFMETLRLKDIEFVTNRVSGGMGNITLLAESIKRQGLIEPPVVRAVEGGCDMRSRYADEPLFEVDSKNLDVCFDAKCYAKKVEELVETRAAECAAKEGPVDRGIVFDAALQKLWKPAGGEMLLVGFKAADASGSGKAKNVEYTAREALSDSAALKKRYGVYGSHNFTTTVRERVFTRLKPAIEGYYYGRDYYKVYASLWAYQNAEGCVKPDEIVAEFEKFRKQDEVDCEEAREALNMFCHFIFVRIADATWVPVAGGDVDEYARALMVLSGVAE